MDVSGTWRGEVRDTRGERLAVELRFAQSGTAIGGSYAIGKRSGTLYGLRIGARVEFDTESGSRDCGGRLRGVARFCGDSLDLTLDGEDCEGKLRANGKLMRTGSAGDRGSGAGTGTGTGTGTGGSAGRAGSGDCIEGTPGACTVAICGSRRCPLPDGAMVAGGGVGFSACCSGPERCGITFAPRAPAPSDACLELVAGVPNAFCSDVYRPFVNRTMNGVGCCRTTDGLCGLGLRDSEYGLICQIPMSLGTEGLPWYDCDPNAVDMDAGPEEL